METPPKKILPFSEAESANLSPLFTEPTRRTFLRKGSGGVLAAMASTSVASLVHGAPDNRIKLGVIGCGGRGTGAANQAMNAGDDIDIVAMCDVNETVLRTSRDILRKQNEKQTTAMSADERLFTGFEDYKRVIGECDVVILATSPGFRPLHFEEAVRQGKHVFMEKPVASDVDGIQRVLAAAKEAQAKNLKVGVGLQRRHQPAYVDLVKRIQDGAIGDIRVLRALWNGGARPGRERIAGETELEYQIRNWYYFTWLSDDHNVEQHVHNLDVVNWIKGDHPVAARGMGGREVRDKKENGQIFDHHFVEYEYADGTLLYSQARQIPGCARDISEHVIGTLGNADLSQRDFVITGPNAYQNRLRQGEDGHQLEHYPLFKAIREDLPHMEAEQGATATMTAILGRMSNYSGQEVRWDEAMADGQKLVPDDIKDFNDTPPVLPDADGWYPVAVPGVTKPFEIWY